MLFRLNFHSKSVMSVALGNRYIASTGEDFVAHLFRIRDSEKTKNRFTTLNDVCLSPDDQFFHIDLFTALIFSYI